MFHLIPLLSSSLLKKCGCGICFFSTQPVNRIFYSPLQAIQCVVNTAHSPVKKHCILSLRLNESLPKSTTDLSGDIKLPYNNDKAKNLYVVSDTIQPNSLDSFGATVIPVDEFISMVENDQFVADAVFSSPENMQRLSSVAPILGPLRLMPSKRNGTLSDNIEESIRLYLQPTVHYEPIKSVITVMLGRLDQPTNELFDNFKCFYDDVYHKRKECIQSLFRSVIVNCENGTQYFVNNKFLIPGKHYFNEQSADKSIVIPLKREKGKKANATVVNQLFDNPDTESVNDTPLPIEEDEDDKW